MKLSSNRLIAVLVLIIGILVGLLITLVWSTMQTNKIITASAENKIIFMESVSLKIGETSVVHGKKGKCGELPPASEEIARKLPKNLQTGSLRVGELGVRKSNKCGGVTPAREIIFEAAKSGSETINLYDDEIQITVTAD